MISVSNLYVSVQEKQIIAGLYFDVQPGSLHVIMGQNGSGKSSFVHTLMGVPSYEVTSGSMTFCGQDLLAMPLHERSKVGIFLAFQQPIAIPGVTVFEFLKEIYAASGRHTTPAEFTSLIQSLFAQVGLDGACLYRGLNENFSGGEKKRLEIVQMLLLQPKLIILDEIDSGLDVDALKAIGNAIANYLQHNSAASCVIITHYRRILDYLQPTAVHIMHAGTIIRSGDAQLSHEVEAQGYDSYGR